MTDLSDFADGIEVEPPLLYRKRIVETPIGDNIAGFTCQELRRDTNPIVYSTLRNGRHFYQKGGGWAISDAILVKLENIGVSRIFVHLGTDDGDVVEFRASDYYQNGESVDPADLEDERDPQSFVPEDEALYVWDGHAGDLFSRPFKVALHDINSPGWV